MYVRLKFKKINDYYIKVLAEYDRPFCSSDEAHKLTNDLLRLLSEFGNNPIKLEKKVIINKNEVWAYVLVTTSLGRELMKQLDEYGDDFYVTYVDYADGSIDDLYDKALQKIQWRSNLFESDATPLPIHSKLSEPELRYCVSDVIETSKLISTFYDQTDQSEPKRVIFNKPYTIVIWKDGTKTMVKCDEKDTYDKEKGLALCYVKKMFGNNGKYYDIFKKFIDE